MTTEERIKWLQESEIKGRMINGKEMTIREAIEMGAKKIFGDVCILERLEYEELREYTKKTDALSSALKDENIEEKELIRMLSELELDASHALTFPYQAYLLGVLDDEEGM